MEYSYKIRTFASQVKHNAYFIWQTKTNLYAIKQVDL